MFPRYILTSTCLQIAKSRIKMRFSSIELKYRDVRTSLVKTGLLVSEEPPGQLQIWKVAGYYIMDSSKSAEVYLSVPFFVHKHKVSILLAYPSPPLSVYTQNKHIHDDDNLKCRYNLELEEESLEREVTSFITACRYGVRIKRLGDPKSFSIGQSSGLGIITP